MPNSRKSTQKTVLGERSKIGEKRYSFDEGKKHMKAELICRVCNAVYEEQHWQAFRKLDPKYIDKLKKTVCPACHAKKGMVSDGTLKITGTFLQNHGKEIMGIIINTEAKENRRDVLNRVERIEAGEDGILVYTGKNQLAVEMGKKIDSAYKGGDLKIKWSKGDKQAYVTWKKDSINNLT